MHALQNNLMAKKKTVNAQAVSLKIRYFCLLPLAFCLSSLADFIEGARYEKKTVNAQAVSLKIRYFCLLPLAFCLSSLADFIEGARYEL
ncbi:hypothetical protein [Cyanothece sp. BG0011]|uniref:hypothetical protein n=1 Tax=Cyanothece sp. BG0011 TaxID=2082950 RepID=UPI0018E4F315|nr:hypothetical protein [Cyanothece sp. BG0011]